MPSLSLLFEHAATNVPGGLGNWGGQVDSWFGDYLSLSPDAQIVEIRLGAAAYAFDLLCERVVLAYGVSVPQLMIRNKGRMRGFPNVSESIRKVLGDKAFVADRGHFLGHASGGELDINLFPHRRALNRVWSQDGKRFRAMERFVAVHSGTLFFHRPIHDDETWIPASLEYGVFLPDETWWTERFLNKSHADGESTTIVV